MGAAALLPGMGAGAALAAALAAAAAAAWRSALPAAVLPGGPSWLVLRYLVPHALHRMGLETGPRRH